MILSCTTLTYPPSVIAFPKFQFRVVFKPTLCELLNSLKEEKGPFQLPTCVIADGNMCFAIDVAEEFEIPTLTFRTHLSKLVEEGEVPFGGEYCYYFIIIIYMSL
ncbi:hypothetical protein Pint_35281 [Pistacia integerrima]|uniref:Uncharacterized protein n=1 Tax=Pistacia integerrima TaxID=434235 RepID=A0ACC0Y4R9_9ROSI|nr:hypothetical protein Pint_35281 [Pistacia integerrima]